MASLNDSVVVIKYFCHKCNKSVELLCPQQKCIFCRTGFVEELNLFESNGTSEESHQISNENSIENVVQPIDRPECSICLLEMESTQRNITLVCRHPFHKDCVKQWFAVNKSCPLCRTTIDAKTLLTPRRSISAPGLALRTRNVRVNPLQTAVRQPTTIIWNRSQRQTRTNHMNGQPMAFHQFATMVNRNGRQSRRSPVQNGQSPAVLPPPWRH